MDDIFIMKLIIAGLTVCCAILFIILKKALEKIDVQGTLIFGIIKEKHGDSYEAFKKVYLSV